MLSTIQLGVLLGLGAGIGLILIFRELLGRPTRQLHLAYVAARLVGAVPAVNDPGNNSSSYTDRLGRVVLRRAAGWPLLHIPHRDLALLRKSVTAFLGERALCALIGLVLPVAVTYAMAVAGLSIPVAIPVGAGIATAALMSYIPVYSAADLARAKRAEFRRAMTSYVDLVALERAAGAGTTQALESAASIGQSWCFQRLRDELAHARWAGIPAWDALRAVGHELRLPELADVGDVMRMSARDGASVYDVLRTRASAMRSELLTGDQARAGARTERATAPLAVTAVLFMLILATPMAMQIT
jgi:Flp pilus assembly protein TadB